MHTLISERMSDEPDFRNGEFFGQKFPLQIEIEVHPSHLENIILNYPGYNGDVCGYGHKYTKIANFLQDEEVGAVVRMGNSRWTGFDYPRSVKDDLVDVIKYIRENSNAICGRPNPNLYLMGVSAGASAIAAVAYHFDDVKKILLIAPSFDAGEDYVKTGLSKFSNEVYVTIGEKDDLVGPEMGKIFYDLATGASKRELAMVPDCDHQFRGEINGRILSKAPFWAFAGDKNYPNPKGGIKLYD